MKVCFLKIGYLLLLAASGYGQDCVCLNFTTAWERVLRAPSLSTAVLEVGARSAGAIQAGLMPNPVLEVEAENLGVTRRDCDTEPPQTTISLTQLVELGGKRAARIALASCETSIAYWDAQIVLQDKRLELEMAFIAVSAAQEKYHLARKKRMLAQQIHECAAIQFQNGKISPIQEKKAQIILKTACISEREACGALEEAKKQLSLIWGNPCPDFDCVDFNFYGYEEPLCLDQCLEGLYGTPDYYRAWQEVCCASRVLKLEKSNRVPDVLLTVGYRRYNDAHAHGWVVGAQMPIPFFNYNQGNVARACVKYGQAEYQMDEVLRGMQEVMTVAYEHLQIAYDTSVMIQQGVLTDAVEVFTMTQEGYQNGKFDYMELLDSQHMVFETQEKYIDVLADYHLHRAELTRLSGGVS